MNRRFTMLDEPFVCRECGAEVPPLGYTARDHCPCCLCSVHVDINPGDRANPCLGTLRPVGLAQAAKGPKIVYRCERCGQRRRNVRAADDNEALLIALSARPLPDER